MKYTRKIFLGSIIILISYFLYRNVCKASRTKEKVFYFASSLKSISLDPIIGGEHNPSCLEINKVYEGLYEYHYTKRPVEIIPNLAEYLPEISPNGLEYTIKIKQGVKFQDNKCFAGGKGREMISEDFVYSIKRAADPKNACPFFPELVGFIAGLAEWGEKMGKGDVDYSTPIQGILAVDKYTIKITLTKPLPLLTTYLTMPFSYIVPREAVEYYKEEFGNHPVGTGPFVIEDFNYRKNKIVAIKNKNYRDKYFPTEFSEECKHMAKYSGKKLPFLDRIETSLIAEEQTRWTKFMLKDIDLMELRNNEDLKNRINKAKELEEFAAKGIILCIKPEAGTRAIVFNCNIFPFKDNVLLRIAMSLAYNREEGKKIFPFSQNQIPKGFIPPILPGYNENIDDRYMKYDLAEAKQMLVEAGYPEGKGLPPIVLDTLDVAFFKREALFFQECMKKIGIEIIISPHASYPDLFKKVSQNECQIRIATWFAGFPDAIDFFKLYYKGLENNTIWGSYDNEMYNELYERVQLMEDISERIELYKRLDQILSYEVPMIYLSYLNSIYLYYNWVENFSFNYATPLSYFQYIDIDLDKK